MVNLLISEVRKGARVFAVVGGSHVIMQERALRAAFRSQSSEGEASLRRVSPLPGSRKSTGEGRFVDPD